MGAGLFRLMPRIHTIDAEVAGEAVRLIVGGAPAVPGATMAEKLAWMRRHGEHLRTLLMLEPRGHDAMHGALLTEPVTRDAHAGLIAMNAGGFSVLSGEAIIAVATIGREHKLITAPGEELVFDTPAGTIRVRPGATGVAVAGVPSFVHSAGLTVKVGARTITVDVAFGGEFYAVADSEAIGVPVDLGSASALIRMSAEIKKAIESSIRVAHPLEKSVTGIHGAIFTGAPRVGADLRTATVLSGRVLRRSPGVTGTAALLAVLDAMGLVTEDHAFTHEGVLGTTLTAKVAARQASGPLSVIVPVIEGAASITGFHEFVF